MIWVAEHHHVRRFLNLSHKLLNQPSMSNQVSGDSLSATRLPTVGACVQRARSLERNCKSGPSNAISHNRIVADRYKVWSALMSTVLWPTPGFDVSLGVDTPRSPLSVSWVSFALSTFTSRSIWTCDPSHKLVQFSDSCDVPKCCARSQCGKMLDDEMLGQFDLKVLLLCSRARHHKVVAVSDM